MKILALEFSSDLRSAAVVVEGLLRGRAQETDTREGRPLGLIDAALSAAAIEREDIECLAVGLGPGSYAGIRSAIALAQGWQLARRAKILGISSVECLAAQAQAEEIYGRVNVVSDAQRNEFYLASYDASAAGYREAVPLRLAAREEVLALAQAGEMVLGPEVEKWFSAGRVLFPDAAMLGQMAAQRRDYLPGERLEPIYLRETRFVKAPPPRIIPNTKG
ncbi:MAG TPA: tRNA (adenosine(37)-N6)-threonylcarbamoyltransferase complex dimerization subunit type 1 TsaB [Haliangiales bacterium]|nr:tRNA (adenosine(37)-N6)-threonylcarbamoyltransferase complex dimerization subunit type 1 TsaB [Haliangiales bacterium]